MKRRRSLLLAVVVLLVFVGTPGWLTYREVRQERLNRTLIEAIKKQDTQVALSALEQGADANAEDIPPDERTAWERLLERLRFGVRPSLNQGPPRAFALLLACEVHSSTDSFLTSSRLHPELVKALVQHGANVNSDHTWLKLSPLMVAVTEASPDLVEFLLDHGANVNERNSMRQTPLIMTLMEEEEVSKARLLLDHGADINAQDNAGQTALLLAAMYRGSDLVKLLLERGASVNITNISGATPLMAARRNGNHAVVKLLQQAGAKE